MSPAGAIRARARGRPCMTGTTHRPPLASLPHCSLCRIRARYSAALTLGISQALSEPRPGPHVSRAFSPDPAAPTMKDIPSA